MGEEVKTARNVNGGLNTSVMINKLKGRGNPQPSMLIEKSFPTTKKSSAPDIIVTAIMENVSKIRQRIRPDRSYPRISFKPRNRWNTLGAVSNA
jgi:hypothetical protein